MLDGVRGFSYHPGLAVPSSRFSLLDPSHRGFWLRRLHSLSGVFPVGVFLVSHLWTNAKALGGQRAFDGAVRDIHHLPALPLIELFGIFLPLGFHAIYGVKLAFDRRRPNISYPYSKKWLYTLQRATGLIAFAFIVWHLWEFRFARLLGKMRPEAFYPTLAEHLSSTTAGIPVAAVVYLVGIAASVAHFANGLSTFTFGWRICVTRRSQRVASVVFALVGIVVFLIGADTALFFATGARFPGLSETSSSATGERCYVVDPTSVTTKTVEPRVPRSP
jgi:succinate dehydrogenase/fumarate reductase cytochrome b subunit (b558 family)